MPKATTHYWKIKRMATGKIIGFHSHSAVLSYYWDHFKYDMEVYNRQHIGDEFQLVHFHKGHDKCQCGKSLDDFLFVADILTIPQTREAAMEGFLLRAKCKECYYKAELQAGRWAPKSIRLSNN